MNIHMNMHKIMRSFLAVIMAMATVFVVAQSQTTARKPATAGGPGKNLVVTRTIDAPVAEVWKYWAESEYVRKWWGPDGFTSPVAKMDFRVGGKSLVCMRTPEGQDLYSTWAYKKIVPLKHIEYIHNLADKTGKKVDPASMGLPSDFPRDVRNVITFKALGDNKTEMIITEYGYTSDQWLNLSRMGLEQCLNKMTASLIHR